MSTVAPAIADEKQAGCPLVWCRDVNDNERCQALHRMLSAKASILTIERPEDFDLKQFDDDGCLGYGDGTKVKLSFQIKKAAGLHIFECPLSADQVVMDLDDTYEITATVVEMTMLDWWLRGFGDQISMKQISRLHAQFVRVALA